MNQPQFTQEDYYARMPCKKHHVVDNYESMLLGVDQGNCFTIMPYEIDSISEQDYKTFEMPWTPFSFRLVLMYNKDYADDFIKELCQFVLKEFETISL